MELQSLTKILKQNEFTSLYGPAPISMLYLKIMMFLRSLPYWFSFLSKWKQHWKGGGSNNKYQSYYVEWTKMQIWNHFNKCWHFVKYALEYLISFKTILLLHKFMLPAHKQQEQNLIMCYMRSSVKCVRMSGTETKRDFVVIFR